MNASLDLARMLNLNLIRQEKRLGFSSSSEFITALNRREAGNNTLCCFSISGFSLPNFSIFSWCKAWSMESPSSKKFLVFKSVINAATISLSQNQSSPDFYKEVNIYNNICDNIYSQYMSTDVQCCWCRAAQALLCDSIRLCSPASPWSPARRNSIKALKGSFSQHCAQTGTAIPATINQAEKTK